MRRKRVAKIPDKPYAKLRLLRLIADHVWLHGYQPSIRELAASMGWTSTAYVQILLGELHDDGIVRQQVHARGLAFEWKLYVTEEALSRGELRRFGVHTLQGSAAKKPNSRQRKLGVVSQ